MRFALEWVLVRSAAAIVPWLPHVAVRLAARPLGTLASWVDRRGRHTAGENLRVVFPDKSPEERGRIRRCCYQTFTRAFLELFWGRNLRINNLTKHCRVVFDTTAAEEAARQGCIFATLHFGNFEWLSLATALHGFPCMIIAQDFKNPALTPIFQRMRQHGGHSVIPQEGAMLRLFKHLKRHGRAASLVDLNVQPDQSATVISCFGRHTCVTVLHTALAQRAGVPIVPALSIPQRDGSYECRFFSPIVAKPGDSLNDLCQSCWTALEPVLEAQPEAWMWMYKHWRYRPEVEACEYPAYANRSKKFDRLTRSLHGR